MSSPRRWMFLATLCIALPALADPDWYQKQPTWAQTLQASRQALARQLGEDAHRVPLPDFGKDPFTIAAWIKTSAGGTILAKTPPAGNWAPQGKSFFIRDGRLNYDIGWAGCVTGGPRVADNKWHHVAISGPHKYHIFVDGRLQADGELDAQADPQSHVVRVGMTAANFPAKSGFNGQLADVRIYRARLDESQIKLIAQGAADPAGCGAMAAHWLLDGDLRDHSGNRNDLTATAAKPAFVAGRAGQALSLDGRMCADAPSVSAEAREAALWDLLARDFPDSREFQQIMGPQQRQSLNSLRLAIQDLLATYPERYPRGPEHLARLASIEKSLAGGDPAAVIAAAEDLPRLRRQALVAEHPLLNFDRLLFIKRKTYQSSHYYTDYIDGCKYYGGNICILSLRDQKVTDLVPSLAQGIFGRFDLSYDARRVVFDWKAAPEQGFRIYEVNIDGSGLRQLTFPPADEQDLIRRFRTVRTPTGIPYASGTDDMHPCYLPDGDIVFVSTRCKKGILCDGPDVLTTTTLHRMDKDGRNIRPISFNSVSEATPSIMADGRIIYTRWEYVDKGGSACKCIWAMHPDGSGSMEIYKNNVTHPTTMIDARDIPGKPDAYVVVGAPHMPLGVGSIIRLDTYLPLRTLLPMTKLTPEIDTPDEHGFRHFRNGSWVHDMNGPLFREPYPLSYKYFLVTYNPDKPWNEPTGYGTYLLDEFGNRELIHKEADYSCWEPYPLRPRATPPVIGPVAAKDQPDSYSHGNVGTLMLQDVYIGLTGIERGRVKYLRVMEDVPRPWEARRYWDGDASGQQHAVVSKGGHLAIKILHGVVPVEADGSAYFQVPADKNVFFQALDENYMELQRMRTFVNLRAGEYRGCVGCHEERLVAPPVTSVPLAARRAPSQPAPQPGETVPRAMHYPTDVQPILDQHCVRCHSPAKLNGIDLTSTPTTLFCKSYESLIDKRLAGYVIDEIGTSGTGGKHAHIEAADPLTYGSHTSKLIPMLRAGHHDVKLSQEEFIRLTTWIDANAPYYGTWEGRRNLKYKNLPDFRPSPK